LSDVLGRRGDNQFGGKARDDLDGGGACRFRCVGRRPARDPLAPGTCSEGTTRPRCAILGHGLGHFVELADTELELDDTVAKQEISVVNNEYSPAGTHLGCLGNADALHVTARITRQP